MARKTSRRSAAVWSLTLFLMVVMLSAGVVGTNSPRSPPSSVPSNDHPTGAPSQAAASVPERKEKEKKHRDSPASRIRPIANSPLQVREEDPNSDNTLAANFLVQYGFHRKGKPLDFLVSPPPESGSGQGDALTQELFLFQSFYGLKQTGKLDGPTLHLMKQDRCGVADIPPEEEENSAHVGRSGSQSPSRYLLLGTKWDKNRLTWKLDTASTNQLQPSTQRRVMKEAFDAWRKVAPLEFDERSGDQQVDIDIKFGSRHHGDDFPFDGQGKVLAHAFGPGEGDIDGDMHLDNDEDWSSAGQAEVSDLYLVATHELGHSLGLSHSRDPGALMYPYYGLTDRLGPDDIKAIQSLYGIRIGQPTTRAPVTRAPPRTTPRTPRPTRPTRRPITRAPFTRTPTRTTEKTRPPVTPMPTTTAHPTECGVEFDVVIQDPRHKHVYSGLQGDKIYRFNAGGVLPGYPSPLNSAYPGAPANAKAVFTVPEKSATYFVKDNKVWRYQGSELDPSYPKDLNPTHFPEVIRFVLPIVDSSGHRRIFVFGSTFWWEYNFDDVPTGSYYRPRPNLIPQYWPAISSDVNYAVMGTDNYIYFISPHSHVVLDSFRRAMFGGRQEGHPQWMASACRMRLSAGAANTQHLGVVWYVAAIHLLLLLLTKC